jgi:hypothetical protein
MKCLHDQLELLTVLLNGLAFTLLGLGLDGRAGPLNDSFVGDHFYLAELLDNLACFVAHFFRARREHRDHLLDDLLLALTGSKERIEDLSVLLNTRLEML